MKLTNGLGFVLRFQVWQFYTPSDHFRLFVEPCQGRDFRIRPPNYSCWRPRSQKGNRLLVQILALNSSFVVPKEPVSQIIKSHNWSKTLIWLSFRHLKWVVFLKFEMSATFFRELTEYTEILQKAVLDVLSDIWFLKFASTRFDGFS